jgi:hypothetical protein
MYKYPKSSVINLLIDRAPNFVSKITIIERLKNLSIEEKESALKQLLEDNQIEMEEDRHKDKGTPIPYYRVKNFSSLPWRETISIGDIEVPRLITETKTKVFPETFNEAMEKIGEYNDSLEKRFTNLVREEQRKYWANVVGVLGVMVSILSLILVGLPKIQTDPNLSFLEVVCLNLGQLLPLSISLGLLVLILRWVVR